MSQRYVFIQCPTKAEHDKGPRNKVSHQQFLSNITTLHLLVLNLPSNIDTLDLYCSNPYNW